MPLPLLEYIDGGQAGAWLRGSAILPAHFQAYARIGHPEEDGPREGELPLELIRPLVEHLAVATTTRDECYFAVWEGFGIGVTVVRFDAGTSAAEKREWWARQPRPPAWKSREPTLELPDRRYHVFRGPIEGATTSLSGSPIGFQSANLWWPADHAWCVATEIDFAWTIVGGSRSCIDAILRDPRLRATETTSGAALGA